MRKSMVIVASNLKLAALAISASRGNSAVRRSGSNAAGINA